MFDVAFATAPELIRELGQRLRTQRLAKSVTQQELAVRAGVSVGAIKKLEATGLTTMAPTCGPCRRWGSWMSWQTS